MPRVATDALRVGVDGDGRLTELRLREFDLELIREERLADAFRVNLPLEGHLDHYVEGAEQDVAVSATDDEIQIHCDGFETEHGSFDVEATFRVTVDDAVRFDYEIENRTEHPLAEVWFPVLGGLHGLAERTATRVEAPGYTGVVDHDVFRGFEGAVLGNEGGRDSLSYPGDLSMPWVNWYDPTVGAGLCLAERDETCRTVTFASRLSPGFRDANAMVPRPRTEDTWPSKSAVPADVPRGLTFSKVAYPHTTAGTFESGEFVLEPHDDDWHGAADLHRDWFDEHFDVPDAEDPSWLRAEQAWFTSILKQPEDRVVGDYDDYADWLETAGEYGVTTGELIGWDDGGLERNYPNYVPDDEFGGWDAYEDLLERVDEMDANLLTFVNYHVLDAATDAYDEDLHRFRRMDSFGTQRTWAWGESTLKAANGLDVRRHVLASPAVAEFRELVDERLLDLVDAGADALQVDKLHTRGEDLDFNPHHDAPPDTAMTEELLAAVADLSERARERNPEFAMAAEADLDRYVPFVDVFYRAATPRSISPLRYAFPEWTSCVHCMGPYDHAAVNGALMLGAVLVVEPHQYTAPMDDDAFAPLAAYVEECLALRERLADRIFLADYRDTRGATVESDGEVQYRVHARHGDGARAVVVANYGREAATVEYDVPGADALRLVTPGGTDREVPASGAREVPGDRVAVLLEE